MNVVKTGVSRTMDVIFKIPKLALKKIWEPHGPRGVLKDGERKSPAPGGAA